MSSGMWKRILLGLCIIFVAIQFIHPSKIQGPAGGPDDLIVRTAPDPSVQILLETACYDCHSNQTRYPWYSRVQPFGWWVASHINDGKRHVNFSTLGQLPPKQAAKKLQSCSDEVTEGGMPIGSYKLAHPEARLTPAQRKLLSNWFDVEAAKLQAE